MALKDLYSNCDVCGGDGIIKRLLIDPDTQSQTWIDISCTKCGGSGARISGKVDSDLIDLLNDILNKVNDIKEKVDLL